MVAGGDRTHEDRLARAAAALAEAEGVAGVRARPERAAADQSQGSGPDRAGSERPDWAVVEEAGPTRPLEDPPAEDEPPKDPPARAPDAEPESAARAIVLRQLSMAPRSRAQLETKLRQRGCDDAVAAKVLDRMTEVGLVDDEAYAEILVRSRQSDKGLARRALAHELRKTGIDPDIAAGALEQIGAADEQVAAEALAAKKMRSMHGLARDVQARRLAGMLARKGYSGDVAWRVIRDAIADADEHQRD